MALLLNERATFPRRNVSWYTYHEGFFLSYIPSLKINVTKNGDRRSISAIVLFFYDEIHFAAYLLKKANAIPMLNYILSACTKV